VRPSSSPHDRQGESHGGRAGVVLELAELLEPGAPAPGRGGLEEGLAQLDEAGPRRSVRVVRNAVSPPVWLNLGVLAGSLNRQHANGQARSNCQSTTNQPWRSESRAATAANDGRGGS